MDRKPSHLKPKTMKSILAIVAAALTLAISGCAHKAAAPTCNDGKCCAKKK
jgi:hypothetical protein